MLKFFLGCILLLAWSICVSAAEVTVISPKTIIRPDLMAGVKASPSPFACDTGITYIPLPAFAVSNYSFVTIDEDNKARLIIQDWPKTVQEINALLPNIATEITSNATKISADVGGIFGASMHDELITIDFMKYRTEPITGIGTDNVIYGRIGAGMRLKIEIRTKDANLGGSLLALAASAKAGRTSGLISTDVIGLNAHDITLSMPFTSDLSEGSIQKIIEALAIVKSKFNDVNTTLSPQFIARLRCDPKADPGK